MPKLSKDFTLSNSVPLDKDAALGRWTVSNANVGADLPLGLCIRQELEITRSTFQALHKKKQDLECSQNLSSGTLPVLSFAKRACVMSGCVPPHCQLAHNGPWNVSPHTTEAKASAHRHTMQQKMSIYQTKARFWKLSYGYDFWGEMPTFGCCISSVHRKITDFLCRYNMRPALLTANQRRSEMGGVKIL